MAKKQILTNADIEKDIISALKNPPRETETSYRKWTVPCILAVILLGVIEWMYPIFILWLLLALLVFGVGFYVLRQVRLKKQIKGVTVRDYTITEEVVHSTAQEHYLATTGRGRRLRRERIDNYTVRFENGGVFFVPGELYTWSEDLRMQGASVFASVRRGQTMIVVTAKRTGRIVAAYSTELFAYKG